MKGDMTMATLWQATDLGFQARPLQAAANTSDSGPQVLADDGLPGVRIVPFRDGNRPGHVLMARGDASVRVNGADVVGGLRVLEHKDELIVGGRRLYFSAESQPVVEVYQHDGSRRRPRCPICRAEIQDGQTIVRCPGCSRIYHQIEAAGDAPAKPCWTYAPTCRFCGHPTSMSGEPTWRPDDDDEPQQQQPALT
jgi:hypothetical protein